MSAVGYYQTDLPFDAIQAFSNLICVIPEYIHGMVRRAHKQQGDNMNTVLQQKTIQANASVTPTAFCLLFPTYLIGVGLQAG